MEHNKQTNVCHIVVSLDKALYGNLSLVGDF